MKIQKDVSRFEKRMKWDKTKSTQIINFIKEDAIKLNTRNMDHKVEDLLFECIQLANRRKINISKALQRHIKEAEKKYSR